MQLDYSDVGDVLDIFAGKLLSFKMRDRLWDTFWVSIRSAWHPKVTEHAAECDNAAQKPSTGSNCSQILFVFVYGMLAQDSQMHRQALELF